VGLGNQQRLYQLVIGDAQQVGDPALVLAEVGLVPALDVAGHVDQAAGEGNGLAALHTHAAVGAQVLERAVDVDHDRHLHPAVCLDHAEHRGAEHGLVARLAHVSSSSRSTSARSSSRYSREPKAGS
jgi:hypothetical protein